jgi:hypothetical protein
MRDGSSGEALVDVTFFDDQRREETHAAVTPALAELLAWAHARNLKVVTSERATLRFWSMLAAMVSGSDPICRWLRRHLALRGASLSSVARGV